MLFAFHRVPNCRKHRERDSAPDQVGQFGCWKHSLPKALPYKSPGSWLSRSANVSTRWSLNHSFPGYGEKASAKETLCRTHSFSEQGHRPCDQGGLGHFRKLSAHPKPLRRKDSSCVATIRCVLCARCLLSTLIRLVFILTTTFWDYYPCYAQDAKLIKRSPWAEQNN